MSTPDRQWQTAAALLIKSELRRQSLTYSQLAERLAAIGVEESETSIKIKLHRGSFQAAFFLQCHVALAPAKWDFAEVLAEAGVIARKG